MTPVWEIHEDNSYTIEERIDVDFVTLRHGIYRYIPYRADLSPGRRTAESIMFPGSEY